MANISTPNSSIYSGWFYDAPNSRMNLYYRGTKVAHASATEFQVDQALDVDGAVVEQAVGSRDEVLNRSP